MGDVTGPFQKSIDPNQDYSPYITADENYLANAVHVRHIDGESTDYREVNKFFEKFGPVLSVQKGLLGTSTALVSFEEEGNLSKVLQATSKELIFKNEVLHIKKGRELYPCAERLLSFGYVCDLTPKDYTQFNDLPNELLNFIFTFLDIQERIQIERVCTRWRVLGMGQPWCEPKHIAFDDVMWQNKWKLTDAILCSVLTRCGSALRSLKLSLNPNLHKSLTCEAFGIISSRCPHLTEIELTVLRLPTLSRNCLAKLSNGCRKLKKVRITYDGERELLLRNFFRNCKELETLGLRGENVCPKSDDFEVINKNLRVLHLYCYNSLHPDALRKLMQRCNSLQEFRLGEMDSYKMISPEVLLKLVRCYRNTLKVLELTGFTEDLIINWCAALGKLFKLEELYMNGWGKSPLPCHLPGNCFDVVSKHIRVFHARGVANYLDENFVKKLLERNENLEDLRLMFCCNLSPGVFKLICKYADSLRALALYGGFNLCKVNNWCELFEALRNLEKLIVDFCTTQVNDKVAQTVSRYCRKLELLSVASTAISDEGLFAISSLPCLTQLNISYLDITDHGIAILAIEGRLETLNVSNSGIWSSSSTITDDSCGLLARFCPQFRWLKAENVTGISNNLVAAFSKSIEEGYLRRYITLDVQGTSVTPDCMKNDQLLVHVV